MTKEETKYRKGEFPKVCLTCAMYRLGRCTVVEGKIAAFDVCDIWSLTRTG